jgi:hypothetical protein
MTEQRQREALTKRVRKLTRARCLSGTLIEQTRRADQVLIIDFHRDRFNVFVESRALMSTVIPPDVDDPALQEMMRGQPTLEPGEITAAWCFACDKTQPGEPEIHVRLTGKLP